MRPLIACWPVWVNQAFEFVVGKRVVGFRDVVQVTGAQRAQCRRVSGQRLARVCVQSCFTVRVAN